MSGDPAHVVVVGASLAGLRACESLRQEGFAGHLTLVGDEPDTPYDRPPLSKALLAGEWDPERVRLRKPDALASLGLDLRLGVAATALDTADHTLTLADGRRLGYDALVVATGASPRRLQGQPTVSGVCVLRTLSNALALRTMLTGGDTPRRLVVIGAGFIGLEVAATARRLGCEVVVLEGAPTPLVRGLGEAMGAAVVALHEPHGVTVRCGVVIDGIVDDGTKVTGVRLSDGDVVAADVVLVAIGVDPAVGWLDASGVTLRDGIACDASLWTGVPGVWAAGDCVRWPNGVFADDDDAEMRVEHWTNAAEQGAAAARNLLRVARGEAPEPFESVPFFWSDQYSHRLQFVGRAHGGDEVEVVAGAPGGPLLALYGWNGRLRAALGIDMPKPVMRLRALVARRASWDEALAEAASLTSPPS